MTLTVMLDEQTERAIEREAARLGISAAEYASRLLAESAGQRASGLPTPIVLNKGEEPSLSTNGVERLQHFIETASVEELNAAGITRPLTFHATGAELIAALEASGAMSGYGDPSIDSPELARQLRKQAETRDWS